MKVLFMSSERIVENDQVKAQGSDTSRLGFNLVVLHDALRTHENQRQELFRRTRSHAEKNKLLIPLYGLSSENGHH
jgi:hypothetical protein